MITEINQRWRAHRDTYRPAGEVINTRAYEVAAIPDDSTAKAFVCEHHYARSFPAARFRFGLYRGLELAGVAVFSQPVNDRTLACLPGERLAKVELGRFVLLDDVAGNGETWFIARCFEQLRREHIEGIVSFSDPVPREDAAGDVVFPGHIGTIYQAHNAAYLGRGTARTLRVLPDGTVFNDRSIQKVRKAERGWLPIVRKLEALGAPQLSDAAFSAERRVAWLCEALERFTRRLPHAGNFKYVWSFDRAAMKTIRKIAKPYPKTRVA